MTNTVYTTLKILDSFWELVMMHKCILNSAEQIAGLIEKGFILHSLYNNRKKIFSILKRTTDIMATKVEVFVTQY